MYSTYPYAAPFPYAPMPVYDPTPTQFTSEQMGFPYQMPPNYLISPFQPYNMYQYPPSPYYPYPKAQEPPKPTRVP